MRVLTLLSAVALLCIGVSAPVHAQQAAEVRLKELARVAGVRENALTGYGLVVGLAGSGDSARNRATLQSVTNTLKNFGVNVDAADVQSRNVAAVMVTATLPAFSESGQTIDVQVSSLGDARSLSGGTLLATPLNGADGQLYALAQGALSVGGYQFEAPGTSNQRNHPTAARVPGGATIERAAPLGVDASDGVIRLVLHQADYTTARRIAGALQSAGIGSSVRAAHAGRVDVQFDPATTDVVELIARLESQTIRPDRIARVVVNERTGTVVAGADVRIGAVSIAHGGLRVEITTDYLVSQPSGVFIETPQSIGTAVVPDTRIEAEEEAPRTLNLAEGATVGDLVSALQSIRLSTRDLITILQSIQSAGALHGELVIE
jgi:flagellar P-ring protein precursor FlgI